MFQTEHCAAVDDLAQEQRAERVLLRRQIETLQQKLDEAARAEAARSSTESDLRRVGFLEKTLAEVEVREAPPLHAHAQNSLPERLEKRFGGAAFLCRRNCDGAKKS